MLHLLAFVSICVIVVYACIAFRDDYCVVDAWGGFLRETGPASVADEAVEYEDDDDLMERYTCSFESGFRALPSSVPSGRSRQHVGAVGRS